MASKNQTWVLGRDVVGKKVAAGLTRKVYTYCDELMTIVNLFESNVTVDAHSHPNTQTVYILEGKFKLTIDNESKILEKGDSALVLSNIVHGITCMEKGALIETFTPMREELI